jgi:hypothetical protein|tara:strand:- start:3625 stop:3819 length:195 start_codon:yes stop_codon:yes gene_type:complete
MFESEDTSPKGNIITDLDYIRTQLQLANRIDMDAELVYNALLLALHGEYETPMEVFADAVIEMN